MKILVVYYSNTGNSRYLAEALSRALDCEVEAIRPRLRPFLFQVLASIAKASTGIRRLSHDIGQFEKIVLVGPIWMGSLVSPIRGFLQKYGQDINRLYYAACCGGGDAEKDSKFGYARVFDQVKTIVGDKCVRCEAFPVTLALPQDKRNDSDAVMKLRLSDDNFTEEIRGRFDRFVADVLQG